MKIKKKRGIILASSIILAIILIFLGTLYYLTSTVNNYSYAEKKWINNNKTTSIDIYIQPNLPVFSKNGVGVFYDYLDSLKEDTGLNFNVITDDLSNTKLINKNALEKDDVLFYKDHYIVVSKNNDINKISDLNGKNIGVIESDEDALKYYFTENKEIVFNKYYNFELLKNDYLKNNIDYLIIPMYKYLDEIVENNFDIIYHLDGLYSYYCLDIDNKNQNLNSIMLKFHNKWQKKETDNLNKYFLSIYYEAKSYTELEKESITNDDFIVGYIENLPYEGMVRNDFTGLTSTYLKKFADLTGVTYKYIKYDNIKKLSNALYKNKIDLAMNFYSLSSNNYDNSRVLGSTEYVVLAHIDNNIVINSLYSLKNTTVDMLSNMNLKYNMASKNLFEINDFANVKSMLKNIDEDSIIIIEKEVYDYYKDSKLKDYNIRYIDTVKLNNTFLFSNKNKAFNELFDFYLSTLSINEVKNESVLSVIETLKSNRIVNFIINNILYILAVILVLVFITYGIIKKIIYNKKSKKEDRLYYFDVMTNLKNRNYLNDNMDFWSSNKVYPQAIIVIDINRLKALNDKFGHEAGDNQIKAVAGVLIKTQRDNSEIMRTDGDEFIVYLVGYDEKKIGTYIHKLNRELTSSLPNKDYGVSIGYSMILSEQTTIDDAINDSLNMIKKLKGK